jgi:hypothetical protein
VSVGLIPQGNEVTGQTTLDLCNGTYPSEALRSARLQVVAVDSQDNTVISTEAVEYQSAAATAQAFSELRSVAASCPNAPVTSPVGEPTVTTRFNPAPDGAWPQTAGVDRLAYDVVTTDQTGTSTTHSVAVYLRRGKFLLGVYIPQSSVTQTGPIATPIAGQTSLQGIVGVFESRLAALPASVVGG